LKIFPTSVQITSLKRLGCAIERAVDFGQNRPEYFRIGSALQFMTEGANGRRQPFPGTAS
jgi:hypothetical protein